MMSASWKTTTIGIVTMICEVINKLFNLGVPAGEFALVVVFILSFFMKDYNVTGGTRPYIVEEPKKQ